MIGYKGFDKDLKCRNYQFEIGKEYTENIVYLCGSGFHFCQELDDVFNHYSQSNGNRFCLIEASGKILHDGHNKKSVCQTIKIVKELSSEEIQEIKKTALQNKNDKLFCIDTIYTLQQKYNFIIGGSISLHLYGKTLKRDTKKGIDLDIIMPYYQKIESDDRFEIQEFDAKSSGNDFSSTFLISDNQTGITLKADVRIDPHRKYENVIYKEKSYKVCEIMATLEAKCRYALEGNSKHKNDILFLINKL